MALTSATNAKSKVGGGGQVIDLFDEASWAGEPVNVIDDVPDLADVEFDKMTSSVCATGVWILYASTEYGSGADWWVYGTDYCSDVPAPFDNTASSIRSVGDPNAWDSPALTTYTEAYFEGEEEFMAVDSSDLQNNMAQSLIVTGCEEWTVYSESEFSGSCACVGPSDAANCWPGFYPAELPVSPLTSAKLGCDCDVKLRPKNWESAGYSANGRSGLLRNL